ncbi:hypothetical protein QBC35DRAFT_111456 [Podospora australis]|uniref:Uncharacterized protein n=1 Tax=Podospora australis TaxID=1536484 RepID=A0AAN7AIP1_9PEZI|nr:hypothetical protein QBC35DRAFT_111456 [Podospora australis]
MAGWFFGRGDLDQGGQPPNPLTLTPWSSSFLTSSVALLVSCSKKSSAAHWQGRRFSRHRRREKQLFGSICSLLGGKFWGLISFWHPHMFWELYHWWCFFGLWEVPIHEYPGTHWASLYVTVFWVIIYQGDHFNKPLSNITFSFTQCNEYGYHHFFGSSGCTI